MTEMNRPLFDPEHLRIAAEVSAKARRQRWLNLTRRLPLLLTIVLGGVVLPLFALAQIVLLLVRTAPRGRGDRHREEMRSEHLATSVAEVPRGAHDVRVIAERFRRDSIHW
jgi:hypothetical protein